MAKTETVEFTGQNSRTIGEIFANIHRTDFLSEASFEWSEEMLTNSKEVQIICGRLNSKFYNDNRIVESLGKASEHSQIEIICGPEIDKNSQGIIELAKEGKIKIWQTEEWPKFHFWVIDRKYLRYEQPHMPNYNGDIQVTVQSEPNGGLIFDQINEFDSLKKDSKKLF